MSTTPTERASSIRRAVARYQARYPERVKAARRKVYLARREIILEHRRALGHTDKCRPYRDSWRCVAGCGCGVCKT